MPKAKKLKSGSWNVMVFSHVEDGKRKYESFTAPTKAEAELKASEYLADKKRRVKHDLTVKEAVAGYITAKTNVLSPSTIRGYRRMERCNIQGISGARVRSLTTEQMQLWISDLCCQYSSKTVRNVYSLVIASVALYAPNLSFSVTLPAKQKKIKSAPSDDVVMALFQAADDKLKICIALAAFTSLRRGEVCALRYRDIMGKKLYIHADIVQDENNKWVYKDMPKNSESVRITNELPAEVIALFGSGDPDEYIVKYSIPNTISNRFHHLCVKLGIEGVRYHDLRHYYASIGAVLGVPDTYLCDFGGWKPDSPVLQNVYKNKIVPISEAYSDKLSAHFTGIVEDPQKYAR